jgi:hypothetical protein
MAWPAIFNHSEVSVSEPLKDYLRKECEAWLLFEVFHIHHLEDQETVCFRTFRMGLRHLEGDRMNTEQHLLRNVVLQMHWMEQFWASLRRLKSGL